MGINPKEFKDMTLTEIHFSFKAWRTANGQPDTELFDGDSLSEYIEENG